MLLQSNPVRQVFLWIVELLQQAGQNWDTFSTALSVILFGSLVYVIVMRLRSDEDPSMRYQSSSAGGSMSILISGTHVTMALAGGVALLTWPLAVETPMVGIVLFGAVAAHYWIEKRETNMN